MGEYKIVSDFAVMATKLLEEWLEITYTRSGETRLSPGLTVITCNYCKDSWPDYWREEKHKDECVVARTREFLGGENG